MDEKDTNEVEVTIEMLIAGRDVYREWKASDEYDEGKMIEAIYRAMHAVKP